MRREDQAHLFFLWLGPYLLWMQLWLRWPPGGATSSAYWSLAMLGATPVVLGLILLLLLPRLGAQGQVFFPPMGKLLLRGAYLTIVGLGLSLVVAWVMGSVAWVVLLLWLLLLPIWLPLRLQRLALTQDALWQLGVVVLYVPFASVVRVVWLRPDTLLLESASDWPTTIQAPSQDAVAALQQAIERHQLRVVPFEEWQAPWEEEQAGPPGKLDGKAFAGVLLPALSTPRWRGGLWLSLGLLWSAFWGWWVLWGGGGQAPLSLLSWVVWSTWFAGWWVAGWLSSLPPSWCFPWLWRGPVKLLWREQRPATSVFLWVVLPSVLVVLGLQCWTLGEQLLAGSLTPTGACVSLVMVGLAGWVLVDPSGSVRWLVERDGELFLRRWGWVERVEVESKWGHWLVGQVLQGERGE